MSWQVVQQCVLSRLCIASLAILFDYLLPDHNADAFRNDLQSRYPPESLSKADVVIIGLTKSLTNWDAQYFLAIAHDDVYVEESWLAFFPLYPTLIYYLGHSVRYLLISTLTIQITHFTSLLIAAFCLNIVTFVLAGVFLHKLSLLIFHSVNTANHVLKLFIFNPASIFFTAFYTESLFSCLTFSGIYCLYKLRSPSIASVLFALSAYTRSNGIVSFGFIVYYQVVNLVIELKSSQNILWTIHLLVSTTLRTIIYCALISASFFIFQLQAWEQFCEIPTHWRAQSEWCYYSIPISYGYVQNQYWEVGFLRYYQLKKIPNFVLATPVLTLIFWSTICYLCQNWAHIRCTLSSLFMNKSKSNQTVISLLEPTYSKKTDQSTNNESNSIFQQPYLIPFAVHALFMASFCLLNMHVEVATRFLFSGSPWPYWAMYHIIQHKLLGQRSKTLINLWQMSYCLLGSILFANFLPFT